MDERPLIRVEWDRWQGLTGWRRPTLGAALATFRSSVAAESATATLVAAATVAPVVEILSTWTARLALRLAAGLAAELSVPRAALVAVEIASTAPAVTAAPVGAFTAGFPGFARLGCRRCRCCRRSAEDLLDPAEHPAAFLGRAGFGCRCGFRALACGGRRSRVLRAVVAVSALRPEHRPVAAAFIAPLVAPGPRAALRRLVHSARLGSALGRNAPERIAFPAMLDASGRLGREDFQLRLGFCLDRFRGNIGGRCRGAGGDRSLGCRRCGGLGCGGHGLRSRRRRLHDRCDRGRGRRGAKGFLYSLGAARIDTAVGL